MTKVSIHEAKTHLSKLLARVASGEEVILARAGKPIAKIVPIETPAANRQLGQDVGSGWVADDFDSPLPEAVLRDFGL